MKNSLTWLVSIIIVLILVAYTFCFQVRYDQVAILTTFDKATPPTLDKEGKMISPGSLCLDAGLYPKWPWPIQQVTTYDKRVQLLETQLEEFQTADHFAVVLRVFVAWHIEDPLKFFIKLQNKSRAESTALDPLVRDLKTIITQHPLDELVNTDPAKLRFDQIERDCQDTLQRRVNDLGYGIAIDRVGIRKIVLPADVTTQVFTRMQKSRQALAQKAKSEGVSQATAITSGADAAKERILAFADRDALAIRTLGDLEAAQYYGAFNKNEKLAIFLRQIETLRKILPNNTTFILPADQIDALKLLDTGTSSNKTASSK